MKFFLVAATAALALAQNTTKPATPVTTKVCGLQFTSPCTTNTECGNLNGFNLTCKKSGTDMRCGCLGSDAACQAKSTKEDVAHQFDECTETRKCIDGSGFTALDADQLTRKTCEEKLYCVREQNFNNATVLKSFCHTCGSCKTQNVKNAADDSKTRFDCDKICGTKTTTVAPTEEPTDAPTTRPSKGTTVAPTVTDAAGKPVTTAAPAPTTSGSSALVASGLALIAVAQML